MGWGLSGHRKKKEIKDVIERKRDMDDGLSNSMS